jgi:hypothetical protein
MSNFSTFTQISGSGAYPLSLAETKQWLRIDTTTDDNFVSMLITASLTDLEAGYGFPLMPKILEKTYATNWSIELATFDANSLVSVKSGSNDYTADAKLDGNYLVFSVLPTADEVVVRFVAGSGSLPQDTTFTMLKYITDTYENRTSELPFQMNKSINTYDNMVGRRKFFYI